jgi:uncharacterized membrane protein
MNQSFTFRKRMLTGLAVLVPLGVTILVLRFLYRLMSGFLAPFVQVLAGKHLTPWMVGLLSITLLFLFLYLVGGFARHVAGRRLIAFGERIVENIPVVNPIYSAAKQVVQAIMLSDQNVFTAVAFIEFGSPGGRTIAFISGGPMNDANDRPCYRMFIPTAPNPTTGFFQILPCDQVTVSDMSVEQGLKMIVSCGVVVPNQFDFAFPAEDLDKKNAPAGKPTGA